MISIPIPGMTEEDEEKVSELNGGGVRDGMSTLDLLGGGEKVDMLREELMKRHESANDKILLAARLISPIVDDRDDWVNGYKWVMEQLRADHEATSSKLEIDLSMAYMHKRRFDDAMEVLKGFERKDASLRAMAATNLSFIYFLEGDYAQAEKHADSAIRADRYNAKALVNKGNCMYVAGDYGRAKETYLEAVGVEANCVEAIFNLGLANLKVNAVQEAHHAFDKLHTILPTAPEALFQLGSIYERSSEPSELEQAAKTYELLLNKVSGDSNLCSRIGQVYEKLDDDNTACHWQSESHRFYPVNLNVISWLGVWYVKREMYEQAIDYFNKAAVVQPSEVKWRLMVSSCYRRLGDFHRAFDLYTKIHEECPENIEALQYLEALCRDLGRPHDEYSKKLEKLRRNLPMSTSATGAGPTGGGGAMTRAGGPAQGPPPGRNDRPLPDRALPDRSSSRDNGHNDRPMPERPLPDRGGGGGSDQGRSPMAAPRAGGQNNNNNNRGNNRGRVEEEDDFADTDVSSLLM